ncbi:hypothetical protein [Desnuesiella massiliensis]|uniref:hypothetical protein n=1 Tax=Desnuesiella massiliensis TaxID=1650662 RepID=UPI0006E3C243|nr:hypothetical protein [Desnuesiella massiliensis]
MNADGILGEQGKLLSYNMFAYCLNNPVNMADPDGRFAIIAALVAAPFIVKAIIVVATTLTAVYAYYTVVKPIVSDISNLIESSDSSANSQPKSETNTKKKKKVPRFKRSEPGRPPEGEHELTPSRNHKTTKSEPPIEGQPPSSSIDKLGDNGELIRRRFFDELGRALRDVDFTNHGNPTQHPIVPHVHTWDWFK